jgi:hypothetical protein
MQTTKIYENTTDKAVNVVGVGIIKPHDRISVSTEYHAPVNLINFPGVIDVLEEEAKGTLAKAPQTEKVEAKTTTTQPQVQQPQAQNTTEAQNV